MYAAFHLHTYARLLLWGAVLASLNRSCRYNYPAHGVAAMELGVGHGGRWPLYRMYALLQRWKHAAIGELLLLRVLSAPPPPPPSGSLISELLVYVRLRRSALERLRSVRRWQLMYVSQLDLFAVSENQLSWLPQTKAQVEFPQTIALPVLNFADLKPHQVESVVAALTAVLQQIGCVSTMSVVLLGPWTGTLT